MVVRKCSGPYVCNIAGNGNTGQVVVTEHTCPDTRNAVWNSNVGKLVVRKRPMPNACNAVWDSNVGKLVVLKCPVTDACNTVQNCYASESLPRNKLLSIEAIPIVTLTSGLSENVLR